MDVVGDVARQLLVAAKLLPPPPPPPEPTFLSSEQIFYIVLGTVLFEFVLSTTSSCLTEASMG